MQEEKKPIGYDNEGFEEITQAISELLNTFPGLDGDEVLFETLGKDYGIAFSNDSGALVFNEKTDVTGEVTQECQYLFYLVYRKNNTSEKGKLSSQGFLDTFGKWLCKEPNIYTETAPPAQYPKLTSGRTIKRIRRNLMYGQDPKEDGTQDWILPVIVEYTNKFQED